VSIGAHDRLRCSTVPQQHGRLLEELPFLHGVPRRGECLGRKVCAAPAMVPTYAIGALGCQS
jgi:hypothetical protein